MARRKHRCADLDPMADVTYHLDRSTAWLKAAAACITLSVLAQLATALGWW